MKTLIFSSYKTQSSDMCFGRCLFLTLRCSLIVPDNGVRNVMELITFKATKCPPKTHVINERCHTANERGPFNGPRFSCNSNKVTDKVH